MWKGCLSLRQDLKETFIDSGVMSAIKEWISPLPDKSLPALRIREELLRILQEVSTLAADCISSSCVCVKSSLSSDEVLASFHPAVNYIALYWSYRLLMSPLLRLIMNSTLIEKNFCFLCWEISSDQNLLLELDNTSIAEYIEFLQCGCYTGFNSSYQYTVYKGIVFASHNFQWNLSCRKISFLST